jgi:transmembrane sensor
MNKVLAARAEAAAWITRLHGPHRTAEMEAGFHRWLSESAENRIEFEGITDIWTAVGSLPSSDTSRLERLEHSAESHAVQELPRRLREDPSRAGRTSRDWRTGGARAALFAGVLVVVLTACWLLKNPIEPTYTTEVGEQRVVQLPDKSRIWMNSETRLRIAFGRRQRQVELIRGEALFEVMKDAPRHFVVVAGGQRVTALGTAFVVRHESDRTAITLVQGKVLVSSSSAANQPPSVPGETPRAGVAQHPPAAARSVVGDSPWVLAVGQRITFIAANAPKIDTPAVESVLAWRRGEVVLNDTPLQEAVSEMNHYDKTTIVIEGPALTTLTVSGLYHTGDNEGFARSIAKMHHLDLDEHDGRIHLKSR